jgi:hypothetical protein
MEHSQLSGIIVLALVVAVLATLDALAGAFGVDSRR